MGEMLSIKGVKAPSPQKGYEVVQNALFIISIYPGPSYKMVLLSRKWVKRQKKWRWSPEYLGEHNLLYTHTCACAKTHAHTQRIMPKMCLVPNNPTLLEY